MLGECAAPSLSYKGNKLSVLKSTAEAVNSAELQASRSFSTNSKRYLLQSYVLRSIHTKYLNRLLYCQNALIFSGFQEVASTSIRVTEGNGILPASCTVLLCHNLLRSVRYEIRSDKSFTRSESDFKFLLGASLVNFKSPSLLLTY